MSTHENRLIGGIDPGKKGGFCTVFEHTGMLDKVLHVPLFEERHNHRPPRKPTIKHHVDYAALLREWEPVILSCRYVILEHLWGAAPAGKGRKDGGASMFKMGDFYGVVRGIIMTNRVPIVYRTPQKWRKILGLEGDKANSFVKARELFPDRVQEFERVTVDEGVCEAALVAYSGFLEPPGDGDGTGQAA